MLIDTLQSVLDEAQSGHTYVTDQEQYGKSEHWEAGLTGDCEDHALWCRNALAQQGILSDLVYAKTETGEGHLVCSVEGYILDNRYPFVMRRDDLQYQWLRIGKPDGTWYKVED